jgi:hypothetical protein
MTESTATESTGGPRLWRGIGSSVGNVRRAFWTAYVLVIYTYLYLCMFRGAPFLAFDHQNYITFLNNPYPFFFEPAYTAAGFVVNAMVVEESRFPVVFLLFTLPPLWIVWRHERKVAPAQRGLATMLFACVLTKAFVIGFIAQRLFFAELWVAALLIYASGRSKLGWRAWLPGMVHFSALSTLPSLYWLRTPFNWRKGGIAFGFVLFLFVYVKVLSGFQLFGYDYSRYLDPELASSGFPLFSVLEILALGFIVVRMLPLELRSNLIGLMALLVATKLLFADLEVFSRIFQIQLDLIIVIAGMRSRRGHLMLWAFSALFLILQLFVTSTSEDVLVFHTTALINALGTF